MTKLKDERTMHEICENWRQDSEYYYYENPFMEGTVQVNKKTREMTGSGQAELSIGLLWAAIGVLE